MLEQSRYEAVPPERGGYVQQQALDALFLEMTDALRRKASALCRFEHSPSFETGDLLNTLYIELMKTPAYALAIAARGHTEFLRVAARVMRNVLCDAARRRKARKRKGDFIFVSLSKADQCVEMTVSPELLLDLDEALCELQEKYPRRAAMLEMRFFGGFKTRELREYWGVADSTVERDLEMALKTLGALTKGAKMRDANQG